MPRILLLLLFLSLLACQPEAETIRIGSDRWPGHAPLFIAGELKLSQPGTLRLVEYPSPIGVVRGLRNGTLDAAMLSLSETLLLQSSDERLDLEILLIAGISNGADVLYVVPPMKHLADLQGQRLGIEDSAQAAFLLSRVLDQTGFGREQLELVILPLREHAHALRSKRVDALISSAAMGPELEALGARRIFDSSALPNEITHVMVVNRRHLNPAQRGRLKRLWYDALRIWQDDRTTFSTHLQQRLGLSTASLQRTLDGIVPGDERINSIQLHNGQLLRQMRQLNDYMLEHGLLAHPARPLALLSDCRGVEC
ncbi:ABC transporter substrate-binding protein [Stutzerimonas sp. NM35]